MIEVGIGIAIIILAAGIGEYLKRRAREGGPLVVTGGWLRRDAENKLMARIDELERRLTDIQDVMIAIDEKLSRSQAQGVRVGPGEQQ